MSEDKRTARAEKGDKCFILHIAENALGMLHLTFPPCCWCICILFPSQRRSEAGLLQPEILPLSVHEEWMETGKNCFRGHHCVCLVLVSICLCHLDCLGRVREYVIQRAWLILQYRHKYCCHPEETDLPFERLLNGCYTRSDITCFTISLWIKTGKGLFVQIF